YQSELDLEGKGHFANFATKADIESEAKIIEIITKNFPSHNIIAEESGIIDNGSEYSWAIDPIDGTIPFVDGLSTFGVSVGLLKDNKPFVGVINMVAQEEIYWAEQGKGAFKNGKKIHVRQENSLEKSTIALEWGHSERLWRIDKHFIPIVEKVRYVYVFGSAVQSLTSIAEGNLDGAFIRAYVWDFAAGAILIKEAGGKFTDEKGNEPDFTIKKIQLISSNGLIHDEMVKTYN
ncbi:hypothetical protein HYW44_01440, partial [Candidatus Daviesbacteria bacterium]|nr:hypothetical protein [Candidatus Daviesbacteria bacterium]